MPQPALRFSGDGGGPRVPTAYTPKNLPERASHRPKAQPEPVDFFLLTDPLRACVPYRTFWYCLVDVVLGGRGPPNIAGTNGIVVRLPFDPFPSPFPVILNLSSLLTFIFVHLCSDNSVKQLAYLILLPVWLSRHILHHDS